MDCTISTARHKHHPYSTHDAVEGQVNLSFKRDTKVDQFSIKFLGRANVCMRDGQQILTAARYVQGDQTFLTMVQPIDSKALPLKGIAIGRQIYCVPFSFTIPKTLVPHACSCYQRQDEQARSDHLPLPPTFDSRRQSGPHLNGSYLSQGRIYYVVQVSFRIQFLDGTCRMIREEEKIDVTPTSRTPIAVTAPGVQDYKPFVSQLQCKDLENNAGGLQAYTNQPLILRRRPQFPNPAPRTSLSVPLTLVFQPSLPGEQPPIVDRVSLKLLCTTSFSAVESRTNRKQSGCKSMQRSHTEMKRLRSIDLAGLAWTKQQATNSPSSKPLEKPYATTLQLPVNTDTDPTVDQAGASLSSFSTCSISQSYTVQFRVSYRAAAHRPEETCLLSVDSLRKRLFVRRSHLTLLVPIQICCVEDKPVQTFEQHGNSLLPEDVVEDGMLDSDRHINELWLDPPAYHSVAF